MLEKESDERVWEQNLYLNNQSSTIYYKKHEFGNRHTQVQISISWYLEKLSGAYHNNKMINLQSEW